MRDDASGYGWIGLIITLLVIWYWSSSRVDTESASFKEGDQSGYQRGYQLGYYAGATSVCLRLDETAPDIASDYRRRNFCY